ncbi:GtrA family protein [Corynebacterium sp.]|uniref:GtrA family protein n=1 Tax=Corynebacterium sp. TaxID=1720 RepID=UPI0026DA9AAE|nr:GtrA family protein [Corynebacterium sp.]MDO5031833.1 GtrA family protein [Corynebacterium sp.]
MADLSFARFASNFGQFLKFGLVGGSGTLVNMLTAVVAAKVGLALVGAQPNDAFMNLFGSSFNVRWYMVFSTVAFLVANMWNYQLNRMWTFRSVEKVSWLRGFFPFLLTGIGAFVVSLVLQHFLMHPESPIQLPPHIFDDSTGFRKMYYWANMISIIVAMPINFIINKVWTFRSQPKAPVVVEETDPR